VITLALGKDEAPVVTDEETHVGMVLGPEEIEVDPVSEEAEGVPGRGLGVENGHPVRPTDVVSGVEGAPTLGHRTHRFPAPSRSDPRTL
jgi:hypothetical protein